MASLLHGAEHSRTVSNAAISIDDDVSSIVPSLNSCKHPPGRATGAEPLAQP